MMKSLASILIALATFATSTSVQAGAPRSPKADYKAAQKRASAVATSPKSESVRHLGSSIGTKKHGRGSTSIFTNRDATEFQITSLKPNGNVVKSTSFSRTASTFSKTKFHGIKNTGTHTMMFAEYAAESATSGSVAKRTELSIFSNDVQQRVTLETIGGVMTVKGTVTEAMKRDRAALIKAAAPYGTQAQLAIRRALAN